MSRRALAATAAATAIAVLASATLASGSAAVPGSFELLDARVSPRHAYFAGRPVAFTFAIAAAAPLDLRVDVVRAASGRVVRSWALPAVAPGPRIAATWDGVTAGGDVAASGRYRVRIAAADGTTRAAGSFTLRSHVYPIRGRHADRGPAGEFGVGRSGGRTHEGFDVDARCGTPVLAARGGVVVRAGHDPVLYGNVVIIRGERTRRDYWYSHLLRTPRLRAGDRVTTGRRIGSVGATGNARTIGCHLHFELRSRGRPIDPEPELRAWDRWS